MGPTRLRIYKRRRVFFGVSMMNLIDGHPMVQKIILLSAGGAVGTLLRYGLSGLAHRVVGETFPWGTLLVNVLGCFVIGLLWAASERTTFTPALRLFLLTGTLGAFTTFSTYGLETFNLLRDGEVVLGAANLLLNNVAGLVAVIGGFVLARVLLGPGGGA